MIGRPTNILMPTWIRGRMPVPMSMSMSMREFMFTARAFTLVELLVVISIMAIMLAIILPSLGAAKEQAWAIRCLSTQRQAMFTLMLYSNDHDGWIMPPADLASYPYGPGNNWPSWPRILTVTGYINSGLTGYDDALAHPSSYLPPDKVMELTRCPAWDHLTWSSNTTYGMRTKIVGSSWLWHRLTDLSAPSQFAMLFDSVKIGAIPYGGQQVNSIRVASNELIHLRHGQSANQSFSDGSARGMDLASAMNLEARVINQENFPYDYGYTTADWYTTDP